MLEDDDIVTDSLGCEIEEHQPLGNLLEMYGKFCICCFESYSSANIK